MAEMSNYLETKVLDYVLRNTADWAPTAVWTALHTADPTDAGSGAEVSAGSYTYARQQTAFNAAHATNGNTANTDIETWTNLPACTVTHIGIWDAATSGNLLFHTAVDSNKTVANGDTISIAAGAITITLA